MTSQEINRLSGSNTAAIVVSTPYETRYRVRMGDAALHKYGGWSTFRFVNRSAASVKLHWTWGVSEDKSMVIPGLTVRNIVPEDGKKSYGFDIENLSAATEIAIGEFSWEAATVKTNG